jgi:hypothetical protein
MRTWLKPLRKLRSTLSSSVSAKQLLTWIKVATLITDAYATVAVAYRRASAAYTRDKEMQQLGTAAVHLVTIATSYMTAQVDEVVQS